MIKVISIEGKKLVLQVEDGMFDRVNEWNSFLEEKVGIGYTDFHSGAVDEKFNCKLTYDKDFNNPHAYLEFNEEQDLSWFLIQLL